MARWESKSTWVRVRTIWYSAVQTEKFRGSVARDAPVRGTHEWNRADQNSAILGRVVDTTERGNPTMSNVSFLPLLPHRPSVHPTNNNCPRPEVHSVSGFE
jgi:hypothetical protein